MKTLKIFFVFAVAKLLVIMYITYAYGGGIKLNLIKISSRSIHFNLLIYCKIKYSHIIVILY